jgi:hypothetical protein
MAAWEYKVAYVDFRGRVSIEGEEVEIEEGERHSGFVRRVLDKLGEDGWELGGVQSLGRSETSYMVFKRPSTGERPRSGAVSDATPEGRQEAQPEPATPAPEPTQEGGETETVNY